VRIRRPVRLALIVAGLAGGWWAGALLGEHYNAPPSPPVNPAAVRGPTTGPPATMGTTTTTTTRPAQAGTRAK
jgi:hypothetical protein